MLTEIPKSLIKEWKKAEKQALKDIKESEGKVLKVVQCVIMKR